MLYLNPASKVFPESFSFITPLLRFYDMMTTAGCGCGNAYS